VRSASKPQIGDRRLAAFCMRDHVIELQQAPLTTTPPVVSAKRTAPLVPNVHLACHGGRNMTAFPALSKGASVSATLSGFRPCPCLTRSQSDAPRLPAHAESLLQQFCAQRLEPALHHLHQIPLGLGVTQERPHLL
jgi:hypothetical protein